LYANLLLVDGVHVTCVYVWCVIYHGYHRPTVYIRVGLIIRNESLPFIFITVKTHESACHHLQKTMLMHKIPTPQPAIELAKVHCAILLHDAAPVRSCRADCRNIACSFGILSGNRCHETPKEDSSDHLTLTWVVLVKKH